MIFKPFLFTPEYGCSVFPPSVIGTLGWKTLTLSRDPFLINITLNPTSYVRSKIPKKLYNIIGWIIPYYVLYCLAARSENPIVKYTLVLK